MVGRKTARKFALSLKLASIFFLRNIRREAVFGTALGRDKFLLFEVTVGVLLVLVAVVAFASRGKTCWLRRKFRSMLVPSRGTCTSVDLGDGPPRKIRWLLADCPNRPQQGLLNALITHRDQPCRLQWKKHLSLRDENKVLLVS